MLNPFFRMYRALFGQPAKIDLWLLGADVAIVLLIIWLDVPEKLHKRRSSKIVAALSDLMFEGQTLAQSTPNPLQGDPQTDSKVMEWETAVGEWRTKVAQYLSGRSSKAASAFLLTIASETQITAMIHPLEGWSFRVSGHQRDAYQALLGLLSNLQRLIENPQAYFE